MTLGTLGFEGAGATDAHALLRQPRRVAVLVYLLLNQRGGVVSRDQLMATFWPEADLLRARNALRQTLSFLRGILGADCITSHGTSAVSITADRLDCDALQLERHLEAGSWEMAFALYKGELLPGFHIEGSMEFDDWMESRRRHLHERMAKAAWELADGHAAQDSASEAAFWGKRAFALSPFSETELQRLLRLLDRVRDWSGALRAFQGLSEHLAKESGTKPSGDTMALVQRVLDHAGENSDQPSAHSASRRVGPDRRVVTERRRPQAVPCRHAERRVKKRRRGERRTGQDRRTQI